MWTKYCWPLWRPESLREPFIEFEYTHTEFSMWRGSQRGQQYLIGVLSYEMKLENVFFVFLTMTYWFTLEPTFKKVTFNYKCMSMRHTVCHLMQPNVCYYLNLQLKVLEKHLSDFDFIDSDLSYRVFVEFHGITQRINIDELHFMRLTERRSFIIWRGTLAWFNCRRFRCVHIITKVVSQIKKVSFLSRITSVFDNFNSFRIILNRNFSYQYCKFNTFAGFLHSPIN